MSDFDVELNRLVDERIKLGLRLKQSLQESKLIRKLVVLLSLNRDSLQKLTGDDRLENASLLIQPTSLALQIEAEANGFLVKHQTKRKGHVSNV